MLLKIILILIVSSIGASLYRLGGWNKGNRLFRIIGVPFTFFVLFVALRGSSAFKAAYLLPYAACFGLTMAAISTYWDFMFNNWDNFWFHGFMLGNAAIPLYWTGIHWWMIGIRAILMAILMGGLCALVKWDILEETGRGFIFIASIFLLLL
jgi:hypothetical protein